MWPNPQFPVNLATFTEEILNIKHHFFVQWHMSPVMISERKSGKRKKKFGTISLIAWMNEVPKISTRLPGLTFLTTIKDIQQYLEYQACFTFLAHSLSNETKQQISFIFLKYCGPFNRLKSHERLLNFSFRSSRLQMFFKIGVQACNFIKRRPQHMCFPVNAAKYLRKAFL